MAQSLEALSLELIERLTTEQERPQGTAGTHLVGGIVKAGAKLEALLRAMVVAVAEADGVDPSELLAATGGRAPPVRRAMAGPLACGLKQRALSRPAGTLPAAFKPVLDDLRSRDSRILAFIALRNEIAKEGREPRDGKRAILRLRELMVTFRKHAGWS